MLKDFTGTPGPYDPGCITDDRSSCMCAYIFSPHHCGAVATVNYSKTTDIHDGDNPTLEEAKANSRLLAKSYELAVFVQKVSEASAHSTGASERLYSLSSEARALLAEIIGEPK